MSELLRLLRKRFRVRRLIGLAFVFVAVAVLLDVDRGTVLAMAWSVVLLETLDAVRDHPRVDRRWFHTAVGAAVTVGSAGLLAASLGAFGPAVGNAYAPPLFGALTVAGLWWTLDGYTRVRFDRPSPGRDDLETGEAMLEFTVAMVVRESLADRPGTVEELAEDCDLSRSRVEDALDDLERAGVVRKRDGRYELREEALGVLGAVRTTGSRFLRRATRPLRLLAR